MRNFLADGFCVKLFHQFSSVVRDKKRAFGCWPFMVAKVSHLSVIDGSSRLFFVWSMRRNQKSIACHHPATSTRHIFCITTLDNLSHTANCIIYSQCADGEKLGRLYSFSNCRQFLSKKMCACNNFLIIEYVACIRVLIKWRMCIIAGFCWNLILLFFFWMRVPTIIIFFDVHAGPPTMLMIKIKS
jgi:hypothetical protein